MATFKCCVVGCTSTNKTHRLFHLPRNDKLRALWLSFLVPVNSELLGLLKDQLLNKRVCQKHFDRYQLDFMGNRLRYGYPSLFSAEELEQGEPLSGDSYDHNYTKKEDIEEIAKNPVVVQEYPVDHLYSRPADVCAGSPSFNTVTEIEMPADDLETDSYRNEHCCGCLKSGDEIALMQFNIQCEPLKDILKVDSIILCYLCKRIARKAEYFIQNVQNNQIHLQNYEAEVPVSKQCLFPTTLTLISLPPVELPEAEEEPCMVMKDATEDYERIFIKEEDISPNLQPKEEVTLQENSCSQNLEIERKRKTKMMDTIKPRKRKIMLVKTSMPASAVAYNTEYTIQHVTEKECIKEREQRSQDSHYQSCIYRCEDCIKGFMHKTSFDMHMNLHSLSRGDFLCKICKQRFESPMKMAAHSKCHIYRYKCTKCDVNRISQGAIRSHYASKHSSFGSSLHHCTICPKVFKNKVSLRKHEIAHSRHERVTCDFCQLTFISKDTLRNHILRKHPPDGCSENERKRHVCQHCGMAFKKPYLLRNHTALHTESRPYYCVECDRSFKTDKILTRHLKTASRHVFNADLHVSCDQCEKKFTCRRDLERHVNSAHLNLRPYACDKCDRAYLNSWSLREHKMYSHEGYRKERRYPCTLCDKVFDRSSILKSHIRTHTGERPYRCEHCPSQFVQSSQLRTHTNLVHLKLTRDGKPKSTALK